MDRLLGALHIKLHPIVQRRSFAVANLRINAAQDFNLQGKADVSNPFSTHTILILHYHPVELDTMRDRRLRRSVHNAKEAKKKQPKSARESLVIYPVVMHNVFFT